MGGSKGGLGTGGRRGDGNFARYSTDRFLMQKMDCTMYIGKIGKVFCDKHEFWSQLDVLFSSGTVAIGSFFQRGTTAAVPFSTFPFRNCRK